MTKRWNGGWFAIHLAIGFAAVALQAKAQPAPSTCSIAPPTVQSFSIERTIMPSDTETTYSTALSEDILSSLAADTMEMREQLNYNPQTNTLTSTVFLVDAGAPIPTPSSVDIASTTLARYVISINGTYASCSPIPSLMFTGTVTSSSGGASAPNGIYNLTFSGTPAAVSIGYTTDNPPMINNVVTLFAGVAVSYSQAGYGTITFPSNAAGQPTITSVVGSASLLQDISANSWVTITGSSLASKTDSWNSSIANGALPSSLDGVSVMIGGAPAYVSYISPGQINAIAPQVSAGPVSVTVTNSAGTSAVYTVTAAQYSPAFFSWPGNQVVATHLNYTYAAKAGTFPGVTTTPARPGETITLWGTGFGPTSPAAPIGSVVPASATYNTTILPDVTLNNSPVTVLGAALTADSAALYQVAIQVPTSLANGDYLLQVSIGGVTSPLGIILTVQQ
ncbi:MAG TPA: IPT/TIG domain-containing protein [Bryobacteraceae bacterium]|nr:IPT/TIG domain-containing protein [Bryobacteraceae bacterium]